MTPVLRAKWIIGILLVHFFIVPCASAMILMPAESECGHCQTLDTPDPCLTNTAAGFAADGLLVDNGRPDVPRLLPALLLPAPVALSPLAAAFEAAGAFTTDRHSGDPPPYLLLGQLRL